MHPIVLSYDVTRSTCVPVTHSLFIYIRLQMTHSFPQLCTLPFSVSLEVMFLVLLCTNMSFKFLPHVCTPPWDPRGNLEHSLGPVQQVAFPFWNSFDIWQAMTLYSLAKTAMFASYVPRNAFSAWHDPSYDVKGQMLGGSGSWNFQGERKKDGRKAIEKMVIFDR